MGTKRRSSLMDRYLDPATSLAEVLFGLIMTLTFTLGAGIIIEDEGREGARELLIALIGCNLAWGIIDAAMYLVGVLFDRGRKRRLAQAIRAATDDSAACAVVAGELDELLGDVMPAVDRQSLYARIASHLRSRQDGVVALDKADLLGAFTSFWLVVLSSVPAAVPFLLIDDARLALRASNAVLLVLLFATGHAWSRYTMGKPWLVGLCFLVGGAALVALAIALGG
ncbi:hypothetical protein MNR01_03170 [Lysobacter sp. S4-A87]|uniref:hypothetical protein n=1 Tax=Lysobacter sp. S4-A87 TaxID=2925843 RepID=UPI001F53AE93|nr:hypothetical protein [Lysobacter sp. S4-A87]UNK50055.1 hypothetical protein MNR01_03170 [Lysobacter sp. S4-A87]